MRLKRQTSNRVAHLLDRRCNDTFMPSNTGPTAHNSCASATVACKILKRSLLVEPLLSMKRSQPRGPAHMIVGSKNVSIPVVRPSCPHLAPPARLGAHICCKSISSMANIVMWRIAIPKSIGSLNPKLHLFLEKERNFYSGIKSTKRTEMQRPLAFQHLNLFLTLQITLA